MLEQLAQRNLALAVNASRTAKTFGLDPNVFAAYMLGQLDAADATLGLESIARMSKPFEPSTVQADDNAGAVDSMSVDTDSLQALLGSGPNMAGQIRFNMR